MGLIGVVQSWLPTFPAFAFLPNSSCPAQIFYAKNCRKALSVGDRIFNSRRQEDSSCLLEFKIRSKTLNLQKQKSSASTTWVRIRLLEHGDMDGFRILDESENIKNPLRVRLGSCSETRQVKRWRYRRCIFPPPVLVPYFATLTDVVV